MCYGLQSLNPRFPDATYIGKTNDEKRRLKEHNAAEEQRRCKKTSKKGPWKHFFLIKGFATQRHVLQFEWAMNTRRKGLRGKENQPNGLSIRARLARLEFLLTLPKCVDAAPPTESISYAITTSLSKEQYDLYTKSHQDNRNPAVQVTYDFDHVF